MNLASHTNFRIFQYDIIQNKSIKKINNSSFSIVLHQHTHFFFLFFFFFTFVWVDHHPQAGLAKFGYKSERKLENPLGRRT
jgi:hypothetical protein